MAIGSSGMDLKKNNWSTAGRPLVCHSRGYSGSDDWFRLAQWCLNHDGFNQRTYSLLRAHNGPGGDPYKATGWTAVGAVLTMPELFKGRRVIHFVDNAGALSNMVNGYAGKPDAAEMINLFHLALLALEVEWYGEWVPSDANLADIMTRPEKRGWEVLKEGLEGVFNEASVNAMRFYEMELPPLGMDKEEIKAWYLELKSKGAAE